MIAQSFGAARLMTATGTVNPMMGRLLGFYVNSTSSGTIVLRDGGGSGTALTGTITPAVGWHALPITYAVDLHATIGGTLNVTFVVC
jgi:hypothetical protein